MRAALAAALAALTACGALVDFDGLTGACRGPCPDDGGAPRPAEDAGGDAAPLDAGAEGGEPDAARDAGTTCPGSAGPPMVRVALASGAFCIDAHEVTNGEYARFVEAYRAGARVTPLPECPAGDPTPGNPTWSARGEEAVPVTHVGWCDAWAFCVWAGKRLCGAVGGGALPFGAPPAPGASQWRSACGGPGGAAYPYGDAYEPKACVGVEEGSRRPLPAAAGRCEGGYGGVVDLSGNVWEWIDACRAPDSGPSECQKVGGAYNSPAGEVACAFAGAEARDARLPTLGFRCCGDL